MSFFATFQIWHIKLKSIFGLNYSSKPLWHDWYNKILFFQRFIPQKWSLARTAELLTMWSKEVKLFWQRPQAERWNKYCFEYICIFWKQILLDWTATVIVTRTGKTFIDNANIFDECQVKFILVIQVQFSVYLALLNTKRDLHQPLHKPATKRHDHYTKTSTQRNHDGMLFFSPPVK